MHKKENPQAGQGMGIESRAGCLEKQPGYIVNDAVYGINGAGYNIKAKPVTKAAIAGQFALYSTGEAE